MAQDPKTAPSKRKRATKAEMVLRRERLEELLILGHPRHAILEKMEAEWEVGAAQVEKMVSAIYAEWAAEKKAGLKKKRADQERRIRLYIRQAIRIRDKVRCEALYAKLVGTEAPKKLAGHDGGPIKIVAEIVDYRVPEAPVEKAKRAA